jgi:hypothetical protein
MSWFGQNVDLGWSATLIRLARPSRAVVHRARTRSTRSGSTPHDHHSLSAQNRPASRRPSRGHGNSRSNGRKPPQLNQSPSINKAPFDQTYPLHSPPLHQTARQVDPPPLRPPSSPILNPHSARGTAAPSLIALPWRFSDAGRRSKPNRRKRPASENLHKGGPPPSAPPDG